MHGFRWRTLGVTLKLQTAIKSLDVNHFKLYLTKYQPFIVLDLLLICSMFEHMSRMFEYAVWPTIEKIVSYGTVFIFLVINGAVEKDIMKWKRAAELCCSSSCPEI